LLMKQCSLSSSSSGFSNVSTVSASPNMLEPNAMTDSLRTQYWWKLSVSLEYRHLKTIINQSPMLAEPVGCGFDSALLRRFFV
jgi:hypothetical protein